MNAPTIYLDNQGSTPVDPRVAAAMQPYFFDHPGNPHASDHSFGWEANAAVERSLIQLASIVCADPDELFFTSGATESNNLAILGLARRASSHRRRILISRIEHKSILASAQAAAELQNLTVELLPVDREGVLQIKALQDRLAEDVLLVSVQLVNNEIGSKQPIEKISSMCRQAGALLHTDAAQALAMGPLDVRELGVDMLSLSAHKIYGPKGIGLLYINRDIQCNIEPLLYGGGQQNGLRSGTLPVPLCVGFGEASVLMTDANSIEERSRVSGLRDLLVTRLSALCSGLQLVGPKAEERHPGNANLLFPDTDAGDLLGMLQPRVAASAGSACTSGIPESSHVLIAMGYSPEQARCCVRFSVGRFTTQEEIERTVAEVDEALARRSE